MRFQNKFLHVNIITKPNITTVTHHFHVGYYIIRIKRYFVIISCNNKVMKINSQSFWWTFCTRKGKLRLLYNEYASKANHFTVSCQYEREPLSPRSTPWGATGLHHILCSIPSNNHLQCCHRHTHSLMVDQSTVVGHVPTVHICSFMCTNNIDV